MASISLIEGVLSVIEMFQVTLCLRDGTQLWLDFFAKSRGTWATPSVRTVQATPRGCAPSARLQSVQSCVSSSPQWP
jgi:hypothetical protein